VAAKKSAGPKRGSAAPKPGGRKKRGERGAPSAEPFQLTRADVRPISEVVSALIEETVYARIRHRALLDVLGGDYTAEKYFARFVELYRRDFEALVYRTLITPVAFAERFAEWNRENDRYYRALWGDANDAGAAPPAGGRRSR
jgi:hypothetical protein